jgi:outer membrane murein-binding lipoprotein Lpp
MNMKKTTTVLSCAAALVLAGCSSGAVTAPHVASIASDVLQFNVGTARIFGDGGAGVPQQGINVAASG